MTRKDYIAIAAVIKDERERLTGDDDVDHAITMAIDDVARGITSVMARDNPRFDRAKFLRACGVGS